MQPEASAALDLDLLERIIPLLDRLSRHRHRGHRAPLFCPAAVETAGNVREDSRQIGQQRLLHLEDTGDLTGHSVIPETDSRKGHQLRIEGVTEKGKIEENDRPPHGARTLKLETAGGHQQYL